MNKTLWNYYKQSADGQKAIHLFEPQPENVYDNIEAIATFVKNWIVILVPSNFLIWYLFMKLILLNDTP